ncbi:MAG: WD40/YVTN/BNR-like repeat-containing protein [bacterium]
MVTKSLSLIILPLLLLGAEWQSLNGPPAGRADDMCMGYDPYIPTWVIYAADQTHKLYKSTNEGELWQVPTSQIIVDNPNCVITAPNNAQIVYVGKNRSSPAEHCIWKSEDGGFSWNYKDEGIGNVYPLCLAVDPSDNSASFVLLGSWYQSGAPVYYRTTNGGEFWESGAIGNNALDVYDIAIVPGSPRRVYLAGGGWNPDAGFYLSTDDGVSFQWTIEAEVRAVAYDPENPMNVWEGEIVGERIGVRKSANGGLDWSDIFLLPGGEYINALAVTEPNKIYAATDKGMFLSTDGGQTWGEINNGMYVFNIFDMVVKPNNPQDLYISGEACIYRSNNGGETWREITKGFKLCNTVGISTSLPGAIYVLAPGTVYKSENAGQSWLTIDNGLTYGCRYSITADAIDHNRVFHCGETALDVNYVRRTTNSGQTWNNIFEAINATYTSIAIDPTDGQTIYLAFRDPPPNQGIYGLQKSTDGGESWENITPGDDIVSLSVDLWSHEIVFAGSGAGSPHIYKSTNGGGDWACYNLPGLGAVFDICSNSRDNKVYARLGDGIYKSRNGGVTWRSCGFLGHNVGALVMDYVEPEILFAALNELPAGRTFLTVDGGAVWTEIPNQLPSNASDLTIDINVPVSLYAATEKGIYSFTPEFINKHLTSSSSAATCANNGKKLLRIYGTDELWICYESGGVIYVVHSPDDGATWSRKKELGQGYTPAIAVRDVPDYPPCIVWRANGELRDTIYFARYLSEDKWSEPVPIVVSPSGIDFGPPSFVIGDYNFGHLAYSDGNRCYYTNFNVYNPDAPHTEVIGSGKNPSIGFMPGDEYPNIHIVLEDDGVIYHSARILNGWTYEVVSRDENITITDCHHPSLVVEGDVVYFVWDGILDNNRNIFWRHLTYTDEGLFWSWIWPVCNTANPSTYAVLTTGFFCSWVEQEGNDYEIYYARYDPMLWVWRDQTDLSNSPEKISDFAHLAHKQTQEGTDIYFYLD